MEGKLLLRYFNIRGKAELIRLVLEEAGEKYEEVCDRTAVHSVSHHALDPL